STEARLQSVHVIRDQRGKNTLCTMTEQRRDGALQLFQGQIIALEIDAAESIHLKVKQAWAGPTGDHQGVFHGAKTLGFGGPSILGHAFRRDGGASAAQV